MPIYNTFRDSSGQAKTLNLRFNREARLRYRAESVEAITAESYELLKKFIEHHKRVQVPRMQELIDYYEGNNHNVLTGPRRRNDEDMTDNRAPHPFAKSITTFRSSYAVGIPIQTRYADNDTHSDTDEALEDMAKQNSFRTLDKTLWNDMSKTGRAFEVVWRGLEDTHIKRLDPLETFVIYDTSIEEKPLMAIRYYKASIFEDDKEYVEVHTAEAVHRFSFKEGTLEKLEGSPEPHHFGQVPIIEHRNNLDGLGDYELVLALIDLYDSAQSDTANYMQDLSDAILFIFGRVEFPSDCDTAEKQIAYMRKMKQARMMNLAGALNQQGDEASVSADYKYKQYDVSGTEAYKKRIEDDIHKFTSTPNVTDDHFSGTTSGEAMKYKMTSLDQEMSETQALFEDSLKQRYSLLVTMEQFLKNSAFKDFDLAKLKFKFTPNIPKSDSETIQNANMLFNRVSDETVFDMLEQVTGVKAGDEMERVVREDPGIGFEPPERRPDEIVGGEDGEQEA